MNTNTTPAPEPLKSLSDELQSLAAAFNERAVTLREVMQQLGANASGLLIVILALPFCAPISIPGLSTPFGLVIGFMAARFALGLPPWLPRQLLNVQLPPKFFRVVLEGASKLIGWIERRLRTRAAWIGDAPWKRRLHFVMILLSALLLLLPLGGIPFTNTLPALAIVIGTLALMERDGLALLAAHLIFVATLVYFSLFALVGLELFRRIWEWLTT